MKEREKFKIVANITPCYMWSRFPQLVSVLDDEKCISYKTIPKHAYKAAQQTRGALENP
jgi:hypothetical protein